MSISLIVVLSISALILVMAGVAVGVKLGKVIASSKAESRLDLERSDAVKRSRAVIGGQVLEQVAPYLPDFPCHPQDVRFLGKPVDFVAFSGSNENDIDEIVFIEVKSGDSALSAAERSIRQAIIDGRVRWVEYRIP